MPGESLYSSAKLTEGTFGDYRIQQAVLIGVDEHSKGWDGLAMPVRTVRAISELLRSGDGLSYVGSPCEICPHESQTRCLDAGVAGTPG